jgi:hypothetical protein
MNMNIIGGKNVFFNLLYFIVMYEFISIFIIIIIIVIITICNIDCILKMAK